MTFEIINQILISNINDSINMNAYTSMEISTFAKKKTFNEDQTLNNNSYITPLITSFIKFSRLVTFKAKKK